MSDDLTPFTQPDTLHEIMETLSTLSKLAKIQSKSIDELIETAGIHQKHIAALQAKLEALGKDKQ